MDAAVEIRRARLAAGLTQALLADRAGTSQATLSAYEAGRKQPTVATFSRILDAAGTRVSASARPGHRTRAELETAGRHLSEVIALAESLPYRPARHLDYPRL